MPWWVERTRGAATCVPGGSLSAIVIGRSGSVSSRWVSSGCVRSIRVVLMAGLEVIASGAEGKHTFF